MDKIYEIGVDFSCPDQKDYFSVVESVNDAEFLGGTYATDESALDRGTLYVHRKASSLDEAFKVVRGAFTGNGKVINMRDMRVESFTLDRVQAGYLPDGYVHVSDRNPNATGFYWCLCRTGSISAKLSFQKVHFKKEHNSRWVAGDWTTVLAWAT